MSDLWERLQAAKARPSVDPDENEAAEGPPPEGWTWVAPLVAERRITFDLEPRFWSAVSPGMDLSAWENVFCFDTETTGLSGSAGTVAFLIGWARLIPGDPPGVEVRQWFLRDHPGEHEMIAQIDAALLHAAELVSFNGASFDLPLLRARWALAGKSLPAKPHRDDLYPSRRLWKRMLDSCRLSRLEETVLGVRRVDDVPGSLVPELWFQYLRQGAQADFAAPLEGVLRHHAQDVYSLLCLDLVLASLGRNPQSPRWEESLGAFPSRHVIARPAAAGLLHPDLGPKTPVDFWGLLALKDEDAAESSLEHASDLWDQEVVAMAWANRLKKKRDAKAVAIWQNLWETKRSYAALEELLKWWEHRERTPAARARALASIEDALKAPFLPKAWRDGLLKRQIRLSRSPS